MVATSSTLNVCSLHTLESIGGYSLDADDYSSIDLNEQIDSPFNNRSASVQNKIYRGLAPEETKAVRRLRLLMILVLVWITTVISILVALYVRRTELSEFRDEFEAQGNKLVSGFRDDSFQKMQALESLSASLTSYTQGANLKWPFVTIPNSHEFFLPYLSLANAASIKILPIVAARERLAWEEHVRENKDWVDIDLEKRLAGGNSSSVPDNGGRRLRQLQYFGETEEEDNIVSPYIKNYVGVDTSPGHWMPWWQYAPVIPNRWFLNFNQLADSQFFREVKSVLQGKAVISATQTFLPGLDFQSTKDFTFTQELLEAGGYGRYEPGEPVGFIHYPVFQSIAQGEFKTMPVAVLSATVYWKTYFQDILPKKTSGIVCVVENDKQAFTYKINGQNAIFLGMSDLHDPLYNHLEISAEYKSFETDTERSRSYTGAPVDDMTRSGAYRIRVYPGEEMYNEFTTRRPLLYALVVMISMVAAITTFIMYDCYVERRQRKVNKVAFKSDAIVSSLFPEQIKDILMDEEEQKIEANAQIARLTQKNPLLKQATSQVFARISRRNTGADFSETNHYPMDYDLDADATLHLEGESAPIADLFPSATVLFMDIAGFTAWSSTREPSKVFILLERIYSCFDKIAKRRGIFKVETVGDCYVAVCGLPRPCEDHAVCMAKFARDSVESMSLLVHRLESELGPDTCELNVRVGIHSGPVTAGVLRGDRARFQLFGDTVNTAARMESNGVAGKIQLSVECAMLLEEAGKDSWIRKRQDKIVAKGKGELQTFWLLTKAERASRASSKSSSGVDIVRRRSKDSDRLTLDAIQWMCREHNKSPDANQKTERLLDYNCDLLLGILKKIIAKNEKKGLQKAITKPTPRPLSKIEVSMTPTNGCLDEVAEIIELPRFSKAAYGEKDIEVPPNVVKQLRLYCKSIAQLYRNNPFHNFEHACHVAQSTAKLLSRIVAAKDSGGSRQQLHDHTFGITSDPLTQFAVIFASLIHDVDHCGVPNFILAKEKPDLAENYKNKAIAEQNSVDIAWNILMEPTFDDLREAIYQNESELKRFRQLVVNCLMATDIFDKDLKALREQRWENAFHKPKMDEDVKSSTNRKATIVIEHIIQASDVSHTMQHWHVYCRWNERLFHEMFLAHYRGRTDKDPTEDWYNGEIWFFDNYVIPLAHKLKECGVFGVSSDEYLNYAELNRNEWESKGRGLVKANVDKLRRLYEEDRNFENLTRNRNGTAAEI